MKINHDHSISIYQYVNVYFVYIFILIKDGAFKNDSAAVCRGIHGIVIS